MFGAGLLSHPFFLIYRGSHNTRIRPSLGRYGEAEPLYQRTLNIYEQELGPNHPNLATSLNNLALLYESMGRYEEAEPIFHRALAIREQELGLNHPDTAASLNNLAALYRSLGRYGEAEPLYQRALSIYEQELGPNHPNLATSLNNLAVLYESMWRYKEAESLYKRALTIREQQLGLNHPDIATSLNNLARLYRSMGHYEESESLFRQALIIREQQLGPDHPNIATTLNNLAGLYELMGLYGEAEPLFNRALAIVEQQLGANHLDIATSLNNLATLYESMGRYEAASSFYQRTLDIYEQQLGPNHPNTATSLNNLAGLYKLIGNNKESENLYQRALAIREQQLGPDHPSTATSLNNLAGLYELTRDYRKAESLYRRALAIREQQLGPDHPDTATSLNNLAGLYKSMERYRKSEDFYQRALIILEQQLGLHPNTAASLNNLAVLQYAQKQFQPTINYLKRGLALEEIILSRNLIGGSDTQKRSYLATIAGSTDMTISLHINDLISSSDTAQLTLTTIFQRKGRILDLFTNLRNKLFDNPRALTLFDTLSTINTQLSNLIFNPPLNLSTGAYQTQLESLQKQHTFLEDQLSRHSSEFADLTASPSLKDIQSVLTLGTALVEFIRYRPVDPKVSLSERFGPDRYVVYILTHKGTIEGIDLGPAAPIDAAIATLTSSLASSGTPIFQVREEAQALDSLVMAPVRQALGNTTTVFLSPDSALNLVPFETLVDENNNYLVERYQFRYLTSGRDLMRVANNPASNNPAVLMGGPTFSRADEIVREPVEVVQRAIDFENNIFPSLDGTETEIQEIAKRLNVEPYLGITATEAQLKAINSPRILHVATHGFFNSTDDNTSNPLLQSGLVLAGVKERQSGPEQDGILSALEVTGMNLQGTQLAVLSACETGLGELAAGEGIYGLRRALVLAGTQSQVISLWKVDDTATQELMVGYYDRLLAGAPRDAALRETQLAFLEHEAYSHPYYWSAFIGSGDWRPLTLDRS